MNGFAFAAPLYLWSLLLLPALWLLLRLTPPKPKREIFPPLRLLQTCPNQESEAAKSPWWITALRLTLAALLILFFAQPMRKPVFSFTAKSDDFVLLLDNGWAAASHKEQITAQAKTLIAAQPAAKNNLYILTSAGDNNTVSGPFNAAQAQNFIEKISFSAVPAQRKAAFTRILQFAEQKSEQTAETKNTLQLAYLTDGLATEEDAAAFALLQKLPLSVLLLYQPEKTAFIGINTAENAANGLRFSLIRSEERKLQAWKGRLLCYDEKMQILGEKAVSFSKGAVSAEGLLDWSVEMRNNCAVLRLSTAENDTHIPQAERSAAALRLLDSRAKQKTVILLTAAQNLLPQPLLSPLYYVAKALEGAPMIAGGKVLQSDLGLKEQNIDTVLAVKPSLLIISDIAAFPNETRQKLLQWVRQGGTILRFAGSSGSAFAEHSDNAGAVAENDDTETEENIDSSASADMEAANALLHLLPVPLRRGERSFGGALSWEQPQPLAPFPQNSPFYSLPLPHDVTIYKQVLAEPSAALYDKSWITLADGTPLMTRSAFGKGQLIFVHTGLDSRWSNLALSGFFVDMLQRIAALSGSAAAPQNALKPAPQKFAPYRIITSSAALETAPDYVHALEINGSSAPQPNFYNPPGFYGTRDSSYALNLLNKNSRFSALQNPDTPLLQSMAYADENIALQKIFLFACFALFVADIILSLMLKSGFIHKFFSRNISSDSNSGGKNDRIQRDWHRRFLYKIFPVFTILVILPAFYDLYPCRQAQAQNTARQSSAAAATAAPNRADTQAAAALAAETRLAYIITGNTELDEISYKGLQNLSRFIERRTTISLGEAVGIDPAEDELAFYPLLYWPADAESPMPSPKAIERADTYMQHGGAILFDTRDALQSGLQADGASDNTKRLRAILAGLNVPPLIPAPKQHVIARSFYIMPDFPGRYRASPLWIAAAADAPADSREDRPIRAGDGVSPILITANDFAAAWADNGRGGYQFALIPDGEGQRLWAFRGGLNIVMYLLTGNYKADQMHTPELLRRLGETHEP